MRILQINAVYGHGSTGTIVRDIEHLCFQSGIECYVASPDPKVCDAKNGYVIGNTLDHKLHAILSRIHGKQAYFSHIPTRNLIRWIEEIKPDIVHLHNLHSNFIHLNMLLDYLAKKDIKTIVTLHDCWFYTGGCFHYTATGCNKWMSDCKNCPKKKQDTPAYLSKHSAEILADRKKFLLSIPRLYITGVSEWMAHEPLKSFLKDVPNYVIRNGIDFNVFKPSPSDFRKELGLEGKYVILGPASKWLLPVNRQVLVDFTSMMKEDEVLLLFGVCSKAQKKYVSFLHLDDKVVTYGYTKNREELAKLYTMADVFVNCTREESLSLINVESQACGTPTITFDATATPETVDGIYSLSTPVGNPDCLYKAVEKIRSNNDGMLSQKVISFVGKNYDLYSNYEEYLNLYKTIGK